MQPQTHESLIASCRTCGGAVPITLAGPLRCSYCGSTEPLTAELGARVAALRARLEHRSAQERHLTGKWVGSVTGIQGLTLVLWITMWVLFGGMALGFALDHDVPLGSFVLDGAVGMDLAARWWMLFAIASGLPLSLFLFALSLYWLRSLALFALPIAPAYAGAPPRCRSCAAPLPDGTALRRCSYCSTDNLILGERYQKSELDLDRALSRLSRGFVRSLDRRVALAERLAFIGALLPIGLLLFVPVLGLVLQVSYPSLWVLPPALGVLALLGLLLASTRKLPSMEPIDCVVLESSVSIGGAQYEVSGQLLLGAPGSARRVLSLAGRTSHSLELAFHVDTSGKRWKQSLWDVRPGGSVLAEGELTSLEPAELRQPGATAEEGVKVDELRIAVTDGTYRAWLRASVTPGAQPIWTLERRQECPLILAG